MNTLRTFLKLFKTRTARVLSLVIAKFVVSRCGFSNILGFSVLSVILADLLGNTYILARVQKIMVCDS